MTLEDFKKTMSSEAPPAGLPPLLVSLWYEGKGYWDKSHAIAQDIDTADGAWIHGYLHRKEGDEGNAAYWYRRASRKFPDITLAEEWDLLVMALLAGDQ